MDLADVDEQPKIMQSYRTGRMNTTQQTHWKLHGTRFCSVTGDAGGIPTGWPLKTIHGLILCRYRNGRGNTTRLTHWRLHGTRVCRDTGEAGRILTSWPLKTLHGLRLCRVTEKAGGTLHSWLTEDYIVSKCALLQERRQIYYTNDSCEILRSVTEKSDGILHSWLTHGSPRNCIVKSCFSTIILHLNVFFFSWEVGFVGCLVRK